MTTALDVIKGALRKIGQYAPGESLDADDEADALDMFNAMLDMWSTQHLAIYNNVETVFNFTPGKYSYTIGAGGDINVQRPLRISANPYTRITNTSSTVDFPCKQITFDQYSAIGLKTQPGPWPKVVYYNTNYPLGQLLFWPVPTSGYEFHLWTDQVLSQLASASTALNLPQGYYLALQTNLALLLATEYGVEPSQELQRQARMSKAAIKDLNDTPSSIASYDGALVGRPARDAGWILTGGF